MLAYSSPAGAEAPLPAAASAAASAPVRGRRRAEWVVAVSALAVAGTLWCLHGSVDRSGLVLDETITLITSDRENLSCALGRSVGAFRCAFRTPDRPWPGEISRSNLLAPYVAVEGQRTFLLPGLFELPVLVARYAAEPPGHQPRDRLRRFGVRCKLRLVERVEEVQARWSLDWAWATQQGVWVATPVSCELE